MQLGEIARREGFELLDKVHGGKLEKLKEENKKAIVEGVTREYREEKLKFILAYAKKFCPFYRENVKGDKLTDFPVLSKGDFINHFDEVLSDGFRDRKDSLARFSTSGSTGTPFTVLADPEKLDRVNMNFMSVLELNGFRIGMKRGEFRAWIKGKNTVSRWHSFKNNLKMIDISNMSDASVLAIFERIKREHIQVLVTYSSALTALVEYAGRTGYDVSGWDVEMIFTMGEALPEAAREKAETLFHIKPVLSYGNNENGFLAVSLNGADTYTADLFNFEFEILKMDSDEPAADGEMGRIVVTDYFNKAFPMIRYDTGDTGIYRQYTDEDGRVHGEFTAVYGRRGSLLYTTSGEPLSIHVFMNNLLNFEGVIAQGKCIQEDVKKYHLILNPVKGAEVDEQKVVDSYKRYLGDDAEISVEYTDGIPVQQSGKTLVCEQRCRKYL